jgi:hypothetical protein
MTPWRKQAGEFEKTDGVIHEKPGLTAAQLAHELGVARSMITRRTRPVPARAAPGAWPVAGRS